MWLIWCVFVNYVYIIIFNIAVTLYNVCVLLCCLGKDMQWLSISCKGPPPLPRSLHTAVMLKNKMLVFGGWVPVPGKDGKYPMHETKWKCSNSLACLNTGEQICLSRNRLRC